MTTRTVAPIFRPGWQKPRTKTEIVERIWLLRDEGRSDHEIAGALDQSVIFVRRILAAGRRVSP
jgi:hypothetical protein